MLRTRPSAQKRRSGQLTPASFLYQAYARAAKVALPFGPSHGRYHLTVSHHHRFVWFRVAKVGTRTVFHELDKRSVPLDAEHPMNCHYPVGHYSNYFKFGFVRNPWDRLLSAWRNKVRDTNHFKFSEEMHQKMQSFDAFVEFVAGQDLDNCNPHIRRQTSLIDLNNVDFVGRFETFSADLSTVLDRLGFDAGEIGHRNATKKDFDWREMYSGKTRDKVAQLYQRDVTVFGYEFD